MAAALATVGLASCAGGDGRVPTALRVGVLPDQAEAVLRETYAPLLDHLTRATGLETSLVVPDSYGDLLVRFQRGELDLAWFGGLTFTRAAAESGARPLVMRDVDLHFTSDFIVPAGQAADALDDMRDARLAFGPELSTSGHLMPRAYLIQRGLEPETFFTQVIHSRGHDQTALWIQGGRADLGVLNSVVLGSMLASGALDPARIRVLERTPPYRDYVWATRPGLRDDLRESLLAAFLDLDFTLPEHAAILARQGGRAYLPATFGDFQEVSEAAARHGVQRIAIPGR